MSFHRSHPVNLRTIHTIKVSNRARKEGAEGKRIALIKISSYHSEKEVSRDKFHPIARERNVNALRLRAFFAKFEAM